MNFTSSLKQYLNNNCDLILNTDDLMKRTLNKRINLFQSQNCSRCNDTLRIFNDFFADNSELEFKVNFEVSHDQLSNSSCPHRKALNSHKIEDLHCQERSANHPNVQDIDSYINHGFDQNQQRVNNFEYFQPNEHSAIPQGFHFKEDIFDGEIANSQEEKQSSVGEQDFWDLPQSHKKDESQLKNNGNDEGRSSEHQSAPGRRGNKITKNVTKNIGKLLFKFIWKYRKVLGHKLKIEKPRWQAFIKVIWEWKKQNNITRQFLISRWHRGSDSAIFRTISRHFFRKRCLAAILKSNIRMKGVHFSRIGRFSAAITDPSALDFIT